MTKVLASYPDAHKDPERSCFSEGVSHSAQPGRVLSCEA